MLSFRLPSKSNPLAATQISEAVPVSSKEFLDIQATTECGFTLKLVRDMIITQLNIGVGWKVITTVYIVSNLI